MTTKPRRVPPSKNKLLKFKPGTIVETRNGPCKVIKYVSTREVLVKFLNTGYKTWTYSGGLSHGHVKDPYHRSVSGVGYFGEGPYKSQIDGKRTKHYALWVHMIARCYNPEHGSYSAYKDCYVHDDWLCFQNFARDIEQVPNFDRAGYAMDKDILVTGNKQYGPGFVCFVPSSLNSSLAGHLQVDGKATRGIVDNRRLKRSGKPYTALITIRNRNVHLGNFYTKVAAREAYEIAKRRHIRRLADQYRDHIDPRAYKALRRYQVPEAA